MPKPSTRPAGHDGFHLAACACGVNDSPASHEWCVRECPRRLLAENARLRHAILDWWDDLNRADATRADEQLRAAVDEDA